LANHHFFKEEREAGEGKVVSPKNLLNKSLKGTDNNDQTPKKLRNQNQREYTCASMTSMRCIKPKIPTKI